MSEWRRAAVGAGVGASTDQTRRAGNCENVCGHAARAKGRKSSHRSNIFDGSNTGGSANADDACHALTHNARITSVLQSLRTLRTPAHIASLHTATCMMATRVNENSCENHASMMMKMTMWKKHMVMCGGQQWCCASQLHVVTPTRIHIVHVTLEL